MTRDWREWHRAYDQPQSPLSRRLAVVQRLIKATLEVAPPGPIRVVSMCAGEARDLVGALEGDPRAADVRGRVVELDPDLAQTARANLPASIEVVVGDAGDGALYAGAVPADVVLACGLFGNITDDDMWRFIALLPSLCARGANVIWTRHRRAPDATIRVREEFAKQHFIEEAFVAPEGTNFGVGMHQFRGEPVDFTPTRLFTFVGFDQLEPACPECGFVYDLARPEIITWLRSDTLAFVQRFLEIPEAKRRVRPAPEVWSPLEYACHVRDVLQVQRERVLLAQEVQNPEFVPMRRDERVTEDKYNEQDPDVVAREIGAAGVALIEALEGLDDAGWMRQGIYNYPAPTLRSVEWIATHTVHELLHHRGDIGTL
jgi:hypothetical protein